MPTCGILGSCLTTTLKEEDREADHRKDGRINSTNSEIGTGQNAKTLQQLIMMITLLYYRRFIFERYLFRIKTGTVYPAGGFELLSFISPSRKMIQLSYR
jgi:hypothetical protein